MRARSVLACTALATVLLAGCSGAAEDEPTPLTPTSSAAAADPGVPVSGRPANTGNELADRLSGAAWEAGSYQASTADGGLAQGLLQNDTMALQASTAQQMHIIRIDGQGIWTEDTAGWQDAAARSAELNTALLPYDLRSQIAGLSSIPTMNDIGTEEVDGVSTTHYQGGIEAGTFGAALNPPQELPAGFVAVDVWVDEQNRIVRYDLLVIPDEGADQPTEPQTTTYEYGGSYIVEAPTTG